MCTYNLTFNDALLERAKHSFPTQAAITTWMEQQIERMLRQISVDEAEDCKPLRKLDISDKIRALSAVPASLSDEDYKDELIDVLTDKYGLSK